MRKTTLCLALLGMMSSASVMAEDVVNKDGTVTFTGKLIEQTCVLEDGFDNITVELPTVSTKKLAELGQQVGSTTFLIKVKECPTEIKKVGAHFEAIANSGFNPETGNLKNGTAPGGTRAASAKNVEVRLYNTTDNKQIIVGDSKSAFFDVKADGTATMSYAGGYYATGQSEAGEVYAQSQFVMKYE
ncbi:fimbrial protein [Enterobacteriaceae bacterium LUAb1]